MLEDDIACLARYGGPSSPYHPIDERQSGFIQSLRAGNSILPQDEWEPVVNKSLHQNQQFVNKVFKDFVRKLPQNGKAKLRNSPETTWQEWWAYGGLAEVFANSLDTGRLIQGRCSLLKLPTVRAAVGYILHTWYQQIVRSAKLKPTEHYDFRNAILAGGVGTIVTQDRKLRNAINHIPGLTVKTWTLEEFIAKVM
jgi:hypothetical protein